MYEREWRSIDPWNFKKDDVVAIMVSDAFYAKQFKEYLEFLDPCYKAIFEDVPVLYHELIIDL